MLCNKDFIHLIIVKSEIRKEFFLAHQAEIMFWRVPVREYQDFFVPDCDDICIHIEHNGYGRK